MKGLPKRSRNGGSRLFILTLLVAAVGCESTRSWLPAFAQKKDPTAGEGERLVRQPDGTWRTEQVVAKSTPDNGKTKPSKADKKAEMYAEAEELFRQEKYSQAAAKFKKVAKADETFSLLEKSKLVKSSINEDSLYMQAESEFHADNLPAAQDAFAKLLTNYPTTRHLPKVIQRTYDIAYYWLEDSRLRAEGKPGMYSPMVRHVNFFDKTRPLFDTEGRAIEAIELIQQYDPLGPLTDDAVMLAGSHEYAGGDYLQAATFYEQLATDQPKSEHAARSLMLGSDAYLRSYLGPQYDGKELLQAQQLTKACLQRGSNLSAEEKERMERQLRIIELEIAKRDYHVAEQYQRLYKPVAAKFYYAKVVKDHADTPFADQAKEQIAKLESEPQKSSAFVAWLNDPFGAWRRPVAETEGAGTETPPSSVPGAVESIANGSKNSDSKRQ